MCKELGLKAEGSSFDMILRMRDVSLNRSSFDWAYEKVFGKTGIVYFCIFFLLNYVSRLKGLFCC